MNAINKYTINFDIRKYIFVLVLSYSNLAILSQPYE